MLTGLSTPCRLSKIVSRLVLPLLRPSAACRVATCSKDQVLSTALQTSRQHRPRDARLVSIVLAKLLNMLCLGDAAYVYHVCCCWHRGCGLSLGAVMLLLLLL